MAARIAVPGKGVIGVLAVPFESSEEDQRVSARASMHASIPCTVTLLHEKANSSISYSPKRAFAEECKRQTVSELSDNLSCVALS